MHQRFTVDQIDRLRASYPDVQIVVHPECSREVVDAADANGSTDYIRKYCDEASSGVVIGVGTEINLVQRLDTQYQDKSIICLDDSVCPCSTMYMIHPRFLAEQLEAILEGNWNRNVIIVDEQTAEGASIALNRMLATQ